MVENGSSGKQPVDNARRLDRVEQWLNAVDDILCNLTQMMAALTTEVRWMWGQIPHQTIDRLENSDSGDNGGAAISVLQHHGHANLESQNLRSNNLINPNPKSTNLAHPDLGQPRQGWAAVGDCQHRRSGLLSYESRRTASRSRFCISSTYDYILTIEDFFSTIWRFLKSDN